VANRRDSHQPGFDDELEHGWAGSLEIEVGDDRPSTGLGPDSGARKWVLAGLGVSCLLTAAVVLLATHDVAPVHAAELEAVPEPTSEREPMPSEVNPAASDSAASKPAPSPAPRRTGSSSARPSPVASIQPSSKADSTFAAGSSVAVQTKPGASTTPKPTVMPKPAATPPPVATPKPVATPQPAATPKPTSTPKPAATPKPEPVEPADTWKLPSGELPEDTDAQLPDVEPWDDADDEAVSADAIVPTTPS
jgi:hypothetical protein